MTLVALAIGFAAGVVSGLLGVGGGILFVPALTLALSLSQVRAESTSLLAIVPVALLGAARQHRYGHVRLADGATIGLLSAAGAAAGALLADALPQRALRIGFAGLMLFVAARLLQRLIRRRGTRRHAGGRG